MANNSNNSGYTTLRSNIPNGGEQMREITIYQLKGEKFLVSENGRGVQKVKFPMRGARLAELVNTKHEGFESFKKDEYNRHDI